MASFFKAFFFFFTSLLAFHFRHRQIPSSPPPHPVERCGDSVELRLRFHVAHSELSLLTLSSSRAAKTCSQVPPHHFLSPPDSSFSDFGQPSLSHILLHFSPISLSLSSLQSLPFSSKIPSLSPSSSLYITSSPSDLQVSINNVKIVGSPIYDDGFVIVFAIEDFFTQNFTRPNTNRNQKFGPSPQCSRFNPFSQFLDVSLLLKSKGYQIMSSFLELQLIGFLKNLGLKLTVFAPVDDAIVGFFFAGDFPVSAAVFEAFGSCIPAWTDLNNMENGTEFKNYVNGLSFDDKKVNDVSFVNGVEITYPDLYYNDWLVVHGLQSLIPLPDETDDEMDEILLNPRGWMMSPSSRSQ
ncbi:hypothetical protein HAX54_010508 [Datura stramonium]|uniref:Uncharacterized protein n=1 Tax=Datura stramonium TaxID=4076 RepID=A0ABS8WYN0_DATST|nr:hypothetical protein [Datura stramonium]